MLCSKKVVKTTCAKCLIINFCGWFYFLFQKHRHLEQGSSRGESSALELLLPRSRLERSRWDGGRFACLGSGGLAAPEIG